MENPKLYVGIDPGQDGAVVILGLESPLIYKARQHTPADLSYYLKDQRENIQFCGIERVHSMPRQGVASSFKFGRNYGTYIGILTALKIPFSYILPSKWQTKLSCLTKGDKNVTKQKAQELFPDLTITHAIADALLIAEYTKRFYPNV